MDWRKEILRDNGPGRVIDRRGLPQPKLDPKKVGSYTGQQLANSRGGLQGTAHRLGLSAYGAQSIRSMGSRLGSVMPSMYKTPDRKGRNNRPRPKHRALGPNG